MTGLVGTMSKPVMRAAVIEQVNPGHEQAGRGETYAVTRAMKNLHGVDVRRRELKTRPSRVTT